MYHQVLLKGPLMFFSCRRALVAASVTALLGAMAPVAAADDHDTGDSGSGSDGEVTVTRHVVESFDDTPIVANLFLPPGDEPAELVLETHGWGGTGRTSPAGMTQELVDDGYAVLTWDQRGFGCSGGQVRIDDPDVEGGDVSALIDWAVSSDSPADIATGEDDDPIVGMIGGSYAGAIQTAAASVDPRIDAIAPDMSWSDLRYSLYPGEVVKQGWVGILYALGTATAEGQGLDPQCDDGPQPDSGLDPIIHRGATEFAATGKVSEPVLDFFAGSSLDGYADDEQHVDVPTLVTQSAVDTLFNLTDGLGVRDHVRAQGADSRLLIYCGGHVNCPTSYADADDTRAMRDAIQDWFAVHLRGEEDVDVGAPITYRTNEGIWRDLDALPEADDGLSATGSAEDLAVVPVLDVPDLASTVAESGSTGGSLQATPLTAATVSRDGDPRAATFEVAEAADGPLELVGVPEVDLTVDGTLLETLGELPAADLAAVLEELSLAGLEPVLDEAGEIVGAAPVAGNVAQGALGGLLGPTAADAVPTDVHVFVKFVHREAGEVVNLQEGAIRVPVIDGPAEVSLRMPGLAYTIPEGDHLDVQVSTASLAHATGRVPAAVDVDLDASVPVVDGDVPQQPPDDDGPPRRPSSEQPGPPDDRPGGGEGRSPGPPEQRPQEPPADRPASAATTSGAGAEPLAAAAAGSGSTPGTAATLTALTAGLLLAAATLARRLGHRGAG